MKDYNANVSGVDKQDMLRQLYGGNQKSMKWWHRLFFFLLLEMAMINAHKLYSEETPITLLEFRRELGQGLLCYGKLRKTPGAPKQKKVAHLVPSFVRLTNTGVHWLKCNRNLRLSYDKLHLRFEVYKCALLKRKHDAQLSYISQRNL